MNDKPLECTSCGKLKDYGEPHNFYDCVQYLKGVIEAKDAQIEALALAVLNAVAFPNELKWRDQAHKLARAAIGDSEVRPSVEAHEEPDNYLPGGGIRTPYGPMTPGFERDNPPWQGGRRDF